MPKKTTPKKKNKKTPNKKFPTPEKTAQVDTPSKKLPAAIPFQVPEQAVQVETPKRHIPKEGSLVHLAYFPDREDPGKIGYKEFVIDKVQQYPQPIALLKDMPDVLDTVWIEADGHKIPLKDAPATKRDAIAKALKFVASQDQIYRSALDRAKQEAIRVEAEVAKRRAQDVIRTETLQALLK